MVKNKGNKTRVSLNILVSEDNGIWLAHCVEYSLFAQGKSFDAVRDEFERVLKLHVLSSVKRGVTPFESLKPAPKFVQDAFNSATNSYEVKLPKREVEPGIPTVKSAKIYGNTLAHAGNCVYA